MGGNSNFLNEFRIFVLFSKKVIFLASNGSNDDISNESHDGEDTEELCEVEETKEEETAEELVS